MHHHRCFFCLHLQNHNLFNFADNKNYGIKSSLAKVFFLSAVKPMVRSRHRRSFSFFEALHSDPIAFLDLHLLSLNTAKHFSLLALHLYAYFLLVREMLSLKQVYLAAPILANLSSLHFVHCYHLSFLFQSLVLGLQATDVAHQITNPDFDLGVATSHMFQLCDKVAVTSDLDWGQSQRIDFFSNPCLNSLSLGAKRFQLNHELLSIPKQILFLQGKCTYLPNLFLVLKDQLKQDLALLSELARLINTLSLAEISCHKSAEQLLRVERSFLI